MAGLTNNEAVFRWVQDHVLHGGLVPGRGYNGGTVRTNDEGALTYVRTASPGKEVPHFVRQSGYNRERNLWESTNVQYGTKIQGVRYAYGPVILSIYIPKSKTFLLNGDGFTDLAATRLQTLLRGLIQRPWQQIVPNPREDWNSRRLVSLKRTKRFDFDQDDGPLRYVIVPFQALEGAEAVPESVLPIDVGEDRWQREVHPLSDPPTMAEFEAVDPVRSANSNRRHRTVNKGGTSWRSTENLSWVATNGSGIERPQAEGLDHDKYIGGKKNDEGWHGGYKIKDGWKIEERWKYNINTRQWTGIWGQNDSSIDHFELIIRGRQSSGVWNWMHPQVNTQKRRDAGGIPEGVEDGQWFWEDQYHQLGSSLFSAIGEDGRRHKFVSAFDMLENPPMYFLAQLPDGSGAKTYQQAMDALAPEIVHIARQQGRDVFRQGDVFAIETNLTDTDIYAMAHRRVRREAVLWAHNDAVTQKIIHGELDIGPSWENDETTDYIRCPCGCGKGKRVSWGPRCVRALSIYRTGHTATEVVVTKAGTTYIRGTMHHDPRTETPGRLREHRDVPLGATVEERKRWHLCTRNTVPRKRRGQTAVEETAERQEVA